ncbi:chemotaxis protein CheB [Chamaesiphon minutus]|uniref:PAS domain S-box n=1 Tax=Chamaesiphon minutus (strain ATCC 27169 / PCC 6605) TaxID=1173020 RepID=K9UJA1_CHAP6|nr:chemotaxis protein CheB [Chamaesiphon minutus]AFY94531.1 PAS domain S-box [Chamaesiphon minutus PCC 6605]
MSSHQSADSAQEGLADSLMCPIVGIGASAGGLEAFTQLLEHLPTDTGMAFVLVQHLDPTHASLLTQVLAKITAMPVAEVADGVAVMPDRVYAIPPNRELILVGNNLKLLARRQDRRRFLPIDRFFQSLATDRQHLAIAVVLSGADGDGSIGLAAVKAAGGITFAQDIASSKFEGMPKHSIATGCVDFILPPEAIAAELGAIGRHSRVARIPQHSSVKSVVGENQSESIAKIFNLLRTEKSVDFTGYKPATLKRRIVRRMALHDLERWDDYVRFLQTNPAELHELERDLLINVTSFFRDPAIFNAFKNTVFAEIVAQKSPGVPIRIWVAGCSTGEEAYSLAMCLLEYLEECQIQIPIQIFATDISEAAIAIARRGIYKPGMMGRVTSDRLHRFFVEVEDGYQIGKSVRELCVFARQNLIADPPFSQLDLISCRNVLIYLGADLQKRLIPIFHYALKPNSFLMLGTSESIGKFSDLFVPVDNKSKIYARKLAPKSPYLKFNSSERALKKVKPMMPIDEDSRNDRDLLQQADRLVLDRYAPVGVTIDNDMNIVQFRGQTGNYLEPPTGKPSFNLFKMAKPELAVELRAVVHQARQQQEIIRQEGVQVKTADGIKTIAIEAIPFQSGTDGRPYLLVLFQESAIAVDAATPALVQSKKGKQAALDRENTRLLQELTTTRECLEAIIEEQESTNQALQVANEEILSSNEELQSTNEELETSQEELQATNEELHTINEELNSRNSELSQINNDLQNLLSSINIPILMLDGELRIRRFSALAQQIFNLIPTDLGRPFSDIKPKISIPDLSESILEVIQTLATKEQEVQDRTGNWYSLRIRPYRTSDNRIDGVTIGLIDIDTMVRNAAVVEAARDYANAIVETVHQPLLVLDADLCVIRANQCFYESFGLTPDRTERQSIFELEDRVWDIPSLRSLLETAIDRDTEFQDFEVIHTRPAESPRILLLNARKIRDDRQEDSILLAIEEITARRQSEAQIQESLAEKEVLLGEIHHRVKNNLQIVSSLLSLQNNRVTDSQANTILQDSQNRVSAMAAIHEILYRSSNLAALNFDEYVRTLVDNLFASYTVDRAAISLSVEVSPDVDIDVDRAVLCGLIINELVTNALKYGFADGREGELSIHLISSNQILTLAVANNGRELPLDFDIRNIRSMGLNLVMSLVKQIKGELTVETGAMTVFKITFPKSI